MKILLSGSSGLVGSEFAAACKVAGDEVVPLVRGPSSSPGIPWSPTDGELPASRVENFDAVVHLAGENVATGRWTPEKKQRIRESRVLGTGLLSRTLAGLDHKPQVLVSASAIGFYGDRGDVALDEESPAGIGFLADVCQEWEAATRPAWEAGIRVIQMRIGLVQSDRGGALPRMLLPFRWGLGGVVGSGNQFCSWIALPDLVQSIRFAIENEALFGAVNAVAPNPVTNREFTEILAKVLNRPSFLAMPSSIIKLAMGEMGEELLLSSTRVVCRKLQFAGFDFRYPDLESALRALLHRKKNGSPQ